MPFPTEDELFKCVMCPCCYEGCLFAWPACCAIRAEALLECDPLGTGNCFADQRIQQCCLNVALVFPLAKDKVKPEVGCCNTVILACPELACPLLCFKSCAYPTKDMFPPAEDACCKTHCYCCVSGYYCKFPQCCAAKVKGVCACAPLANPAESISVEASNQVCFNYARIAIPLSNEIPSKIGCCGIECWTNPNHVVGEPKPVPQSEAEAQETSIQNTSAEPPVAEERA